MSISWIEILCKHFFIFLPGIPDRQADYKLRSLSQRAMHRDASAMAFGNPSGNGKPQPGTIGIFAAGFRSPEKPLRHKNHDHPGKLQILQHSRCLYENICHCVNQKAHLTSQVCLNFNGRGSWTRTNACWIQNPVPYQLGDTPINHILLCREQRVLYDNPSPLSSIF